MSTKKPFNAQSKNIDKSFSQVFAIRPCNLAIEVYKIINLLSILQTNIATDRFDFLVRKGNSLPKLLLPERTESILRLSLRNRLVSRCVEIANFRVKLVNSTIKDIALSSRNVTFNNGVSNMLFKQTKLLGTLRINIPNLNFLHELVKFCVTDRQGTQFFRKIKNRILIFLTLCVCIKFAGIRFIKFDNRIIYTLRLAHLEKRGGASLNI